MKQILVSIRDIGIAHAICSCFPNDIILMQQQEEDDNEGDNDELQQLDEYNTTNNTVSFSVQRARILKIFTM